MSLILFKLLQNKKPVQVQVELLDGALLDIDIDSASTAQEVITAISKILNLKDSFGFSIFITLYDKVCINSGPILK